MASNIKIVGNILNTSTVERYSEGDIRLISSKRIQELFGGEKDYIEYFIYDAGGNLLNTNYNYLDYKLPSSSFLNPATTTPSNTTGQIQTTNIGIVSTLAPTGSSLYPIIEIDPIQDLQDLGYSSGEFNVRYNFFERKISDFNTQELFVKEISRDRTEIRLGSVTLTDEQIESGSLALINKISNTEDYYVNYILNFGDNQQYVAVNVALNKDPEGYEILFKLYSPLPLEVQEKQTLWVVEEKAAPYSFDINLDRLVIPPPPPTLRGPNFDIEIRNQGTVSTAYNNYSNLISSLQSLQSSSYSQIQSLTTSQSIDINVDYSNFNNFVFFGSAYQRVVNFYNKIKEIEGYQSFISTYTPFVSTTASLQTTINQYSASINNIIAEFDGFEYYLYFNSGSLTSSVDYSITPYPKSGSLLPYTLFASTSPSASVWYNYATGSALEYDANNKDNLEFAVPAFIKDDTTNQPFLLFLNMVGHYFDNIWIYLKAVTDINLANNNLDYGISRDLVYQQLKSLGIKLYNSQAGDSVANYLVGANTGSALWSNNFSATSSYLNNIPRKDLVAELYKRIYHNLPLLVKTKGTVAGLDYLMTIFGIPNRDYYTIGSESFYTPTGSALTSSILNVKEFGGSLKSELVNGYNNDKVRIVNNTITGSVLSPLLSLQTYPTASSAFRDDDLHYVDISFSPQTQIDTRTSLAIASNAPTWSIDDYIGDPSQLYSGSYPDLDVQRRLYYQTGVSGYPGFTSSLLDYNGFIRLIEFFDNSLFKMLNDFVPERTSLSTGVTINSPVLERNKASYSKPTVTTQSVYEANYDIADISSQYGTFYNALSASNNTKAWYDGNISGSVVDINQYFEDNYNPYLQPTSSIDVNFFNHSDWNVLLNNVSRSVDSQYRRKIEYFYGTTSSITYPAELQDSYLSLSSYDTSRYNGSKVTSLLYNTYTSGSYTGPDGYTTQTGDKSFGKTAAIDHNVRKIGLFTRIETSSFLPKRNNVSLKYLVDEFGGLTELNQLNKSWQDIQNIFVARDNTTVTLFDNKKFGNQTSTDGIKPIFNSGYTYAPVLYFSGSCPNTIYFENLGDPSSYYVEAINLNGSNNYFISGSPTLGFPVSGGIGGAINNIFNHENRDEDNIFTPGTFDAPPTYSIAETGKYKISASFTVSLTSSISMTSTWSLQVYSGATIYASSSQNLNINTGTTASFAGGVVYASWPGGGSNTSWTTTNVSSFITTKPIYISPSYTVPIGTLLYKYSSTGPSGTSLLTSATNTGDCNTISLSNPITASFWYSTLGPSITLDRFLLCAGGNIGYYSKTGFNVWVIPDAETPGSQTSRTFTIDRGYANEANALSFNSGDSFNIRLALISSSTANYTASISQGGLKVSSLYQSVGYATATCTPRFIFANTGSNTIALSGSLSSFYDNGYLFTPNPLSGSQNSLYSVYGDVNNEFVVTEQSIMILQLSDSSYVEYTIISTYIDDNDYVNFILDKPISPQVQTEITNGTYKRFLLLTRIEDETNMYVTYIKRPGLTSYGFVIPDNLAPDILKNIDTITKEVKQKLLADQQGNTSTE